MPLLPDTFRFSVTSLQDYLDCPRRFELRYLLGLRWPAVRAEPVERYERSVMLGQAFHRLVSQHTVGVPMQLIRRASEAEEAAPELARWWQTYEVYRPIAIFGGESARADVHSEMMLEADIAGQRVVARYDLLIIMPGERVVILDWKTGDTRPSDSDLKKRMQTRLYCYLLVRAGSAVYGGRAIDPEQVEMIYWFPEHPDSPARLPYSAPAYAKDDIYLAALITEVVNRKEGDFGLTEDERQCRYCTYRSYCDRGTQAGCLETASATWELAELGEGLDFDYDDIAEIEY